MGGNPRREARRRVDSKRITNLVADLQARRITRHLGGSARRRQPLRSGMLQLEQA